MAYNITKSNSASTVKTILFVIAVIVSLVIINILGRSIYDTWRKKDLVVKAKTNLAQQKEENRKLKLQLSMVNDPNFVEKEARDKLFLVKPGESGVIVPQDLINKKERKEVIVVPNYQQWIDLILGR